MFKISAFSVDTGRQTTPPFVDGVVHNRLVQFSPHGDQTLAQLVDVLECMPCFVHFSGFGTAKIIATFYESRQKCKLRF